MTPTEFDRLGELVRVHDPDRYLASMFAPPGKRPALWTLAAFNHELARAREVASQPMLALIRLQWWREVVEGVRRRHEVAGLVGEAIDSGMLVASDLAAMVEGREAEADDRIADMAAWRAYLEGTAGAHAVAAGRVLEADGGETLVRLRAAGAVYGAAGLISNVAAHARQGRCLLPADLLGVHGLTADHVIQRPEAAAPVLADLRGTALGWLDRRRWPRSVLPAVLPVVLARQDLRRGCYRRGPFGTLGVVAAQVRGLV